MVTEARNKNKYDFLNAKKVCLRFALAGIKSIFVTVFYVSERKGMKTDVLSVSVETDDTCRVWDGIHLLNNIKK
ncbi:conserved domain protein [Bacteroides fluxus YIT 12057]|uniref:Conserved domain protein n=1 Tax=Bacteroides fluxus YIT 12057 TaxID=763034 RepID=F3PSL9_9BACE|nr:conserved domain protein [Bacteroides fluxus YIT 12057]